ncbi:hypothetical protein GQ54DRAFT_298804 [Martensiomyces pterosporus]|nr:hypothetical protein GQ54DRAFT_298804 [Martensiomyces pterosporus]
MEHISQDEFENWDKEAKALGDGVRSLVAISAAASANYPNMAAAIARRRLQQLNQTSDKVHFVQQSRESILKMTSLMGIPKGINAMQSLMDVVKPDKAVMHELSLIPPLRSSSNYSYELVKSSGRELFNGIYGKHAEAVETKLRTLYPDMAETIMLDSYGHLLSEARYLNGMETELCAIGALVPQDVAAQLKSHYLGAARLGATEEMVQAALRLAKLVTTRRL